MRYLSDLEEVARTARIDGFTRQGAAAPAAFVGAVRDAVALADRYGAACNGAETCPCAGCGPMVPWLLNFLTRADVQQSRRIRSAPIKKSRRDGIRQSEDRVRRVRPHARRALRRFRSGTADASSEKQWGKFIDAWMDRKLKGERSSRLEEAAGTVNSRLVGPIWMWLEGAALRAPDRTRWLDRPSDVSIAVIVSAIVSAWTGERISPSAARSLAIRRTAESVSESNA